MQIVLWVAVTLLVTQATAKVTWEQVGGLQESESSPFPLIVDFLQATLRVPPQSNGAINSFTLLALKSTEDWSSDQTLAHFRSSEITFPIGLGRSVVCLVGPSTVLDESFKAKYPEILAGFGICWSQEAFEQRNAQSLPPEYTIDFDYSPYSGFHARIESNTGSVTFVEPAEDILVQPIGVFPSFVSFYRVYSDVVLPDTKILPQYDENVTEQQNETTVLLFNCTDDTANSTNISQILGDGVCDPQLNHEGCNFDDGDCCMERLLWPELGYQSSIFRIPGYFSCRGNTGCECAEEEGCPSTFVGDGTCDPVCLSDQGETRDCCGEFANLLTCDGELECHCPDNQFESPWNPKDEGNLKSRTIVIGIQFLVNASDDERYQSSGFRDVRRRLSFIVALVVRGNAQLRRTVGVRLQLVFSQDTLIESVSSVPFTSFSNDRQVIPELQSLDLYFDILLETNSEIHVGHSLLWSMEAMPGDGAYLLGTACSSQKTAAGTYVGTSYLDGIVSSRFTQNLAMQLGGNFDDYKPCKNVIGIVTKFHSNLTWICETEQTRSVQEISTTSLTNYHVLNLPPSVVAGMQAFFVSSNGHNCGTVYDSQSLDYPVAPSHSSCSVSSTHGNIVRVASQLNFNDQETFQIIPVDRRQSRPILHHVHNRHIVIQPPMWLQNHQSNSPKSALWLPSLNGIGKLSQFEKAGFVIHVNKFGSPLTPSASRITSFDLNVDPLEYDGSPINITSAKVSFPSPSERDEDLQVELKWDSQGVIGMGEVSVWLVMLREDSSVAVESRIVSRLPNFGEYNTIVSLPGWQSNICSSLYPHFPTTAIANYSATTSNVIGQPSTSKASVYLLVESQLEQVCTVSLVAFAGILDASCHDLSTIPSPDPTIAPTEAETMPPLPSKILNISAITVGVLFTVLGGGSLIVRLLVARRRSDAVRREELQSFINSGMVVRLDRGKQM